MAAASRCWSICCVNRGGWRRSVGGRLKPQFETLLDQFDPAALRVAPRNTPSGCTVAEIGRAA
jgi:hypothetical protein